MKRRTNRTSDWPLTCHSLPRLGAHPSARQAALARWQLVLASHPAIVTPSTKKNEIRRQTQKESQQRHRLERALPQPPQQPRGGQGPQAVHLVLVRAREKRKQTQSLSLSPRPPAGQWLWQPVAEAGLRHRQTPNNLIRNPCHPTWNLLQL